MSFEKLVIYIALIMLVLCLVVVFVMLYYANTSKLYPPNIRICPDFHILSPPENNGESDFCKPYYMGDISNTGSTMSCTSTNTTYCPMNVNPSKKDTHKCGSSFLIKRSDDNEQTVIKRFETYLEKTLPLLNYYKDQNLLHELNGSDEIDHIFKEIQGIIATLEG